MADDRADKFCLVTSDSDFAGLCRKLRERGWAGEVEPDVAALIARLPARPLRTPRSWARGSAAGDG